MLRPLRREDCSATWTMCDQRNSKGAKSVICPIVGGVPDADNYLPPRSSTPRPAGQPISLALYETDFGRYLDIEHDLPPSETGGALGSEVCYRRAKGYCPQRTLWIKHLLAIDLYREAMAQADPADRGRMLGRALGLARATLAYHRPDSSGDGFTQCIETSRLIELIGEAQGPTAAAHDVAAPMH